MEKKKTIADRNALPLRTENRYKDAIGRVDGEISTAKSDIAKLQKKLKELEMIRFRLFEQSGGK